MEYLCLLLLVVPIALWVYGRWLRQRATEHEIIDAKAHPNAIADTISDSIGMMWKPVAGDGDLNFRRRGGTLGQGQPPVISIGIEALEGGVTRVEIWMSRWSERYGIVLGAEHVIRRRKKLVQLLESL